MSIESPPNVPEFFYLLNPKQLRPGDIVHELNGLPLRDGPMAIREIKTAVVRHGRRTRECLELVPEDPSRGSQFIYDVQVKVAREARPGRVNPIVTAAAASLNKPKTRRRTKDLSQPCQGQLPLFDLPEGRRP
ncbi:hypothetical protein ACLMAJ_36665 [Nocardia sp. KC 131]|uniref:hypothetical protein n=1 Tax=Nocardia arseniciresistens TaxID=3392119 RepID=UPI00398F37F7